MNQVAAEAVRLQPAPDHRDVVLERGHVVAGQLVAPDRVGQRVLRLDPVVPGGEHREHLPGPPGQVGRGQVGSVVAGHRQLSEHSDAHR